MNRSDGRPAGYAEPDYRYLNNSSQPAVERIRTALEEWFLWYPDSSKPDLRARFRDENDVNHRGAYFELFLHEILRRLGCHVVPHPELQEGTTRPDFLVKPGAGGPFYLEAVLATDESPAEAAARQMTNLVYDTLNRRIQSPNFFIGMKLLGSPSSPPPGKKMAEFLDKQLSRLDPDEVARAFEEGGENAIPHWPFEHAGWTVTFFPMPKSPGLRGKPGVRPLGIWENPVRMVTTWEAIRDAVIRKGSRYGELDLPYVIAVDVLARHISTTEIMEGLFGQEQVVFHFSAGGPKGAEPSRALNGAWTSPEGARYTRVSAVLVGERVLPFNSATAPLCLYHNPWASRPYASILSRLPQALPVGDRMEWKGGILSREILGLPEGWPG